MKLYEEPKTDRDQEQAQRTFDSLIDHLNAKSRDDIRAITRKAMANRGVRPYVLDIGNLLIAMNLNPQEAETLYTLMDQIYRPKTSKKFLAKTKFEAALSECFEGVSFSEAGREIGEALSKWVTEQEGSETEQATALASVFSYAVVGVREANKKGAKK